MMNNTELFNLYIVPNIKYAKRVTYCFVHNKFYADDVFGDVLIHLFRYIHTYDAKQNSAKSWLYVSIKHFIYRQIRKYDDYSSPTDDFRTYGGTDSHNHLPMSAEELKSGVSGLSDRSFIALSSLDSIDVEIILLRCNGYSIGDLAKKYDVIYPTMQARCNRAKRKFISKYNQVSAITNFKCL